MEFLQSLKFRMFLLTFFIIGSSGVYYFVYIDYQELYAKTNNYEIVGYSETTYMNDLREYRSLKKTVEVLEIEFIESFDKIEKWSSDLYYDIDDIRNNENLTIPKRIDDINVVLDEQQELEDFIWSEIARGNKVGIDLSDIGNNSDITRDEKIVILDAEIKLKILENEYKLLKEEADEEGFDYAKIDAKDISQNDKNKELQAAIIDYRYYKNAKSVATELNSMHIKTASILGSSKSNESKSNTLDKMLTDEVAKRSKESWNGNLKIMSYNVLYSHGASGYSNYGTRYKNIGRNITSDNPAIVGVQELKYGRDMPYLMSYIPSKYRSIEYTRYNQQNGIIYDTTKLVLVDQGVHNFNVKGSNGHRGITWATFRIKGTNDLILYNTTHFTRVYSTQYLEAKQSVAVVNNLKAKYNPKYTVFGGDFNWSYNDNVSPSPVSYIQNNLNMTCRSLQGGTFPSNSRGRQLDYNCVSNNMTIGPTTTNRSYYNGGKASDHIPVINTISRK